MLDDTFDICEQIQNLDNSDMEETSDPDLSSWGESLVASFSTGGAPALACASTPRSAASPRSCTPARRSFSRRISTTLRSSPTRKVRPLQE